MKGSMVMKITNRKKYIGTLKECLEARDDFGDLVWKQDWSRSKEYLILSDIIGGVLMLDITGKTEAEILHAIAMVECGKAPAEAITDRSEKMRIAQI